MHIPSTPTRSIRQQVFRLTVLFALFFCLVIGASRLPAAPLQGGCAGSNGTLPIGNPGEAGYAWKAELRNWLAGLTISQLSYQGQPTRIKPPYEEYSWYPSWVSSGDCENTYTNMSSPPTLNAAERTFIEQYYTMWLTERRSGWYDEALRIDPRHFTLADMENQTTCQVDTPQFQWDGNPSWISMWEYPGNPFFSDSIVRPALKKRLGSWLALQLIMLEWSAWDEASQAIPLATAPVTHAGRNYHHPNPVVIGGVGGNNDMGIVLTGLASAYQAVQNEPWFQGNLAAAFEKGLLTQAERLHIAGYWSQHGNRAIPMVSGLQLVYEATGNTDAEVWYLDAMEHVFTPSTFFPAGYMTQDFRYDPGYSQMDPHAAVRVLMNHSGSTTASALVDLYDAAYRMHDLRAHMVLGDVTGLMFGPSAMSTRTGGGANSNGNEPTADPMRLMTQLYAAELELPFADPGLRDWPDFGQYAITGYPPYTRTVDPLDPSRDLHVVLACRFAPLHQVGGQNWSNSASAAVPWPDQPGPRGYNRPWTLVFDHVVPSTGSLIEKRAQRVNNDPTANLLPYELEGPYLRSFEDEIVFAKFGGSGVYEERGWNICVDHDDYHGDDSDLAAILHLGPVVGNNSALPYGYGGGQLAGLWSPETGVGWLNRRVGRNNTVTDDWAEWRSLPIHAATVLTSSGVWTSSARIIDPMPTVVLTDEDPTFDVGTEWLDSGGGSIAPVPESDAVAVFAEVSGNLPTDGHQIAAGGTVVPALNGATPIHYRRRFVVEPELVRVRTDIDPVVSGTANADALTEAWETLPLFVAETSFGTSCPTSVTWPVPQIEVLDAFGVVTNITTSTSSISNVRQVKVKRNDGTMTIVFREPQTVRLSDVFGNTATTVSRRFLLQNLMVDLRPQGAGSTFQMPPVALEYYIYFGPVNPGLDDW